MPELTPTSGVQADVVTPFELSVLAGLRERGFSCEHRGTYVDGATRRTRDFDIRALRRFGNRFLRVAAECLDLAPDLSLLLSCTSVGEGEVYHEVVLSVDSDRFLLERLPAGTGEHVLDSRRAVRLRTRGAQAARGSIGVESVLVDPEARGERAKRPDDDWERAVRSAEGLTLVACGDGRRIGGMALTLVLPLLVVPDGRLWRADYDATGRRVTDPEPMDRCPYLVRRMRHARADEPSTVNGECVTLCGLHQLVDELTGSEQALESAFPGIPATTLRDGLPVPSGHPPAGA